MLPFTLRSISDELWGRVDFELIAVNNFCQEAAAQGREEDKGGGQVEGCARFYPWLKPFRYQDKLSHWQAKNFGVQHSTGEFLWFCDAHCMIMRDALVKMYEYYKEHHEELNGTLHLPLSYHILEAHRLIYKLVTDWSRGELHYSFSSYREPEDGLPYKVPCMSTCGMLMTRKLFDELGGWPRELGIYGGGENFLNFTLAVLGKNVHIMPGNHLCHHGDKRGYSWNYDDHTRNRAIANYMVGGVDLARDFIDNRRGSKRVLYRILNDVLDKCRQHRGIIEGKQVITIQDWAKQWGR